MRAGIIVEGRSDAAVITNILKGKLNISKSDIQYLVPEFDYDESSLFEMNSEQFSNWTIVKQNCLNRQKIADFVESFENNRFVVIHLDTDTRTEIGYDVKEPIVVNNITDIELLRQNIVNKIIEWLENHFVENIAFAIAIQEIDAWVLSIHANQETGLFQNAKERLFRVINMPNKFSNKEKQKIFSFEENKYEQYHLLSQEFRKRNSLHSASLKNISLKKFCETLELFDNE